MATQCLAADVMLMPSASSLICIPKICSIVSMAYLVMQHCQQLVCWTAFSGAGKPVLSRRYDAATQCQPLHPIPKDLQHCDACMLCHAPLSLMLSWLDKPCCWVKACSVEIGFGWLQVRYRLDTGFQVVANQCIAAGISASDLDSIPESCSIASIACRVMHHCQ